MNHFQRRKRIFRWRGGLW